MLAITLFFALAGDTTKTDDSTFESRPNIVYANREKQKLRSDFYLPKGEGPFPCVIMIHGGSWRTGARQHMLFYAEEAARRGIAAMCITYRLAPTYKHPAQIDDCRDAHRFLLKHAKEYKIDATKIGALGYSAGAHLALLMATQPVDDLPRLFAVAGGGSPTDFQWVSKSGNGFRYWLGKSRGEDVELYKQVSPLHHLTKDDPPTFLFHGEKDILVPIKIAKRFYAKAQELKIISEMYTAPGDGHIGNFFDGPSRVKAVDFFLKVLEK